MILCAGKLTPSLAWRRLAAKGDRSFICSASKEDFERGESPVHLMGLVPAEFGTLLKMKGPVMPHADPFVGELGGIGADTEAEPLVNEHELSLFWLVRASAVARPGGAVKFQCGNEARELEVGDFVIFRHSDVHCLVTMVSWEGVAWQLGAYAGVPHIERLQEPRAAPVEQVQRSRHLG